MIRKFFTAMWAAIGGAHPITSSENPIDREAAFREKRRVYMRQWRKDDKAKKAAQAASVTRDCRVITRDCRVITRDFTRNSGVTDTEERPEIRAVPSVTRPTRSLSKKFRNLGEREGKGGVGERGPLPPDFEPDAEGRAIAVERLGEIGATNLVANFREHYSDDPILRTPRQWQRLFRETWAKRERPAQASLRLYPPVPKEKPPEARGWQPGMPTDEENRRKYGGANG